MKQLTWVASFVCVVYAYFSSVYQNPLTWEMRSAGSNRKESCDLETLCSRTGYDFSFSKHLRSRTCGAWASVLEFSAGSCGYNLRRRDDFDFFSWDGKVGIISYLLL